MAADTIELNTGTGLQVSHGLGLPRAPLNMNHYANKKSAAESMLDVALLMANASQLKAVLEQGPQFTLYTSLITLISLSLCLQVLVGILLIFIDVDRWCWGGGGCQRSCDNLLLTANTEEHCYVEFASSLAVGL
ncbi:hypothetical protein QQF64_031429 [Cirrhinus molitorella]|uniref:Ninjurin 1 n=1 Tax=Cirrhinus molitorella TaxID=172907 RepID=A0ABR3MX38_9TELE